MATRLDTQIVKLHKRLTELGLEGFSLEASDLPDHVRIDVEGGSYHVNPDRIMGGLEELDNLDGTDSEDFADEVWDVIRENNVYF